MRDTALLKRYRNTSSSPERQALEYLAPVHDGSGLDKALRALFDHSADVAFVVVTLRDAHLLKAGEIAHVFDARTATTRPPRLCIGGSHAALGRLDVKAIDFDNVGLMLDGADADTPPAQLIWDRIEAIRFAPDFLTRAAHNLRLGCALEAMLGLSKAMGLCTLGTDSLPQGACIAGHVAFDYLPASLAVSSGARRVQPEARMTQTRAASRGGDPLHPISARIASGSGTDFSSR